MVIATRVSLDEFLALEETKPYLELIDGEVVPKAMPGPQHSTLVIELGALLRNYLRETGEARVDTELRHVDRPEERVYLPDLCVTLKGRIPAGARGAVEVTPDLAIEVLSPDDRASRTLERVDFYLRSGCQLLWVVDPEFQTISVHRPGQPLELHRPPDWIDAQPVLASFELDLAALFALLDE